MYIYILSYKKESSKNKCIKYNANSLDASFPIFSIQFLSFNCCKVSLSKLFIIICFYIKYIFMQQ